MTAFEETRRGLRKLGQRKIMLFGNFGIWPIVFFVVGEHWFQAGYAVAAIASFATFVLLAVGGGIIVYGKLLDSLTTDLEKIFPTWAMYALLVTGIGILFYFFKKALPTSYPNEEKLDAQTV